MKFKDGYWEIREGVKNLNLIEVFDAAKTESTLTVYTATKKIAGRGDSVSAILLTAEFSSPMPDVIRVRMYHHKGEAERSPAFARPPSRADHVKTETGGEECVFSAASLSLRIPREGPWRGIFERNGKTLTEILGRQSGCFSVQGSGSFMAQYLKLTVGEAVYGLGERFGHFVKNGQTVDTWNEDGGTASEQAYKCVPFYITNRGYGVFVSNPGRVSFEAASEVVSAVQFSVPGEMIDYYVIAGDSLHDVLRNYTAITGRPALPPPWSFGLWLSTSFTTDYDEKTVNRFIDGMARRKLPLSVFHFDCFWMKGCRWVDFEWDRDMFPDPVGMLRRIREKGLRICVWINPYVAQKSPLFDEGMEKGYLVKKADGDVWQWDRWQSGMGLVDFSNPEAAAWYRDKLKKLLDMGVDCFKTDFGERIPTEVVWHDGSDPEKMHNYYTYLYNKTVFGLLEETRGRGEAIVFARSATAGGQQFPVHWGGDCAATYESMAETLRGGLSLSLCGFGFWSHDISGFEQTASADLFKRWVAFGLLSSHSRLHGNQSYRVPWSFDEEASDVLRFFTNLKCSLMPYLWQAALVSHREGVPMLRAMVLEYPDDPACVYLDRQYFLGPNLLVSPVFNEDGNVDYYLPPGRWTNIISGEVIEGGLWKHERHGYMSLPLLARPSSVIPFGSNIERPDYDYGDGVCFHVFETEEGMKTETEVSDSKGDASLKLEVCRDGGSIRAEAGAEGNWKLLLRNIHQWKSIKGGEGKDTEQGLLVEAKDKTISIDL
ncbi:MAG: alpha-xylosidase [Treponema sp.]|jgi:alpha-D-xyloside xylohydrolase|nr:alpha-xylosidase [Treponema sp.]